MNPLRRVYVYYKGMKTENNYVSINRLLIGVLKRERFKFLKRRFGFDDWHISPKELRPYTGTIINWVNEKNFSTVAEIGCGLGEIIKNITVKDSLYGFDIDSKAILAAKYLDKKKKVVFQVGSFSDAKKISCDCLICVNFIHAIPSKELKCIFDDIISHMYPQYIIVDLVDSEKERVYAHNFNVIFSDRYILETQFGPYKSNRFILIYKRNLLCTI